MGYIGITVDDSKIEHRTICAPTARAKDITLGIACIPGNHTGNQAGPGQQYMNVQQARECQDEYGHDMYSHAYSMADHNDSSYSGGAAGFEASLEKMVAEMARQGLGQIPRSKGALAPWECYISSPQSPGFGDATNGSSASQAIQRSGFRARRSAMGGYQYAPPETVQVANNQHIRTWMHQSNVLADMRAAVTKCRLNPYAFGLFVHHGVLASPVNPLDVTPTYWQALLDEIAFQRDNGYQSDQASNTASGKLVVGTMAELAGGVCLPTF